MQMKGGNKSIINHVKDGKTLHLFEQTRKTYVRYVGEAECVGYHEELRPDSNGDQRIVFIFHIALYPSSDDVSVVVDNTPGDFKNLRKKSFSELRIAALLKSNENISIREKIMSCRYRAKSIKLYVFKRANGICEGCGEKAPFSTKTGPYLECHHLYRLADGGARSPSKCNSSMSKLPQKSSLCFTKRNFCQITEAKSIRS